MNAKKIGHSLEWTGWNERFFNFLHEFDSKILEKLVQDVYYIFEYVDFPNTISGIVEGGNDTENKRQIIRRYNWKNVGLINNKFFKFIFILRGNWNLYHFVGEYQWMHYSQNRILVIQKFNNREF